MRDKIDSIENRIKEHFQAVMDKNLEHIVKAYSETEDLLVFVEGPRWLTEGFHNVAKGWHDFVNSRITVIECGWVETFRTKQNGNLGFIAGLCELKVMIGDKPKKIRFRGSFVLEQDSKGEWKIIHEHFSQPATDPYGIGDWLVKENQ